MFESMRTSPLRLTIMLLLALPAFLAAMMASQIVPTVLMDRELTGPVMPLVGIIQLGLGLLLIAGLLRIGRLDWRAIGWRLDGWPKELAIGLGIAAIFALLQFGFIIPATGGAERSDVVANLAQIGEGPVAIGSMLLFQLMGPTIEEFWFRGLLLNGVAYLAGRGNVGKVIAVAVTTLLFALSHGYQGVAGMIDTGLYGGLTLSLLYFWRKSLIAPIAAHVGWNMLAVLGLATIY